MPPHEVDLWARDLFYLHVPTFKHTQKWCCEFCNVPARMSETQIMSWVNANPPKMNIYIHSLCNPSEGPCADTLRRATEVMARMGGHQPPPRSSIKENPEEWPLMGSCAGCEADETARHTTRACSACQLTRYCSEQCQKKHWNEHKAICKLKPQVKWYWD
ncbi:unnamed protein product [Peniophora sp. CBMAI 1063]|nr:unnamed protein product [Peniophora sp. CBMAI 1063]